MKNIEYTDVAIVGGGVYGMHAADEISRRRPDLSIRVLEQEDEIFKHASSTNQGQFHMGYMYSADPALAVECIENRARFMHDFEMAVDKNVTSFYGIHENSEISPDEYVHFCESLELPLKAMDGNEKSAIFGKSIVEVFETAEKTFNSRCLRELLVGHLALRGVGLDINTRVKEIAPESGGIRLATDLYDVVARVAINASFANINQLHVRSGMPEIPLRSDTFLHFVIDLPSEYADLSATVIRGPFASLMSSRFRRGHVLASAAFRRVNDIENIDDIQACYIYDMAHNDAESYLPILKQGVYKGYTIGERVAYQSPDKTYTSKAIVFENFDTIEGYHVILGGKVPCVFDIDSSLNNIASTL